MLHSFGQDVHLAFQNLALVRVAIAQVVPLEALVIGVEVVRDAAVPTHLSRGGIGEEFCIRWVKNKQSDVGRTVYDNAH